MFVYFVWCFDVSRDVENRETDMISVLSIQNSKTTIFCQKWHSFAIYGLHRKELYIRRNSLKIFTRFHQQNIHSLASYSKTEEGIIKCFKFLQTNLLWKQLKAASGKQFTSQVSSLRTSSCPFHIALWLCFFLIEAIPRCLWPENQLWRVWQSLRTWLNEVERSWLAVPLDFAETEMIRQTFAMSCYAYLQHQYAVYIYIYIITVTINGTSCSFIESHCHIAKLLNSIGFQSSWIVLLKTVPSKSRCWHCEEGRHVKHNEAGLTDSVFCESDGVWL